MTKQRLLPQITGNTFQMWHHNGTEFVDIAQTWEKDRIIHYVNGKEVHVENLKEVTK